MSKKIPLSISSNTTKNIFVIILSLTIFLIPLNINARAWNSESELVGHLDAPLPMSGGVTEEQYWDATFVLSPLGVATCDAMILATDADFALLAAGDLSINLWSGDATWGDVKACVKDREVVTMEVTPMQLCSLLEYSLSYIVISEQEKVDDEASATEANAQYSGFYLQYDISGPVGERVQAIILDDETVLDLEDNTTHYTLATTSYLAEGGYGYPVLEVPYTSVETNLQLVLADYVASGITKSYENTDDRLRAFGSSNENSIYSALPAGLIFLLIAILFLCNRSRLFKYYKFER